MYYDRFGRSLDRPRAATAPRRTPADHADPDVLKSYLDSHRTVWHAESLVEIYPEIVDYLDSRYVAARRDGGLRLRAVDGSYPDLVLADDDLLLAAEALLSREYRHALFEQLIAPSIERLSA